jgi:PAS domain S-box-containing protein
MSKKAVTIKKPLIRSSNRADEITLLQTDCNGIIISTSDEFSSLTGLPEKKLIGTCLIDLIGKKDFSKFLSFIKGVSNQETYQLTISLKCKSRNRSFAFIIYNLPGANSGTCLLQWTINPRHLNVAPVQRNRVSTASSLFDTNPQPVIICDTKDDKIVYANEAAQKFYSRSKNEFVTLSLLDLLDTQETVYNKRKLESFSPGSYFFIKRDEKHILLNVYISRILIDRKNYQLVFTNIPDTEKIKSLHNNGTISPLSFRTPDLAPAVTQELDFKKAYEDAVEMLGNAPEIFFKLDANGDFLFVSNELERVLGYTKNEILGKHFTSIIEPDDTEVARQGFADIYQFGRAKGNILFRAKKKKGGREWLSTSGIFTFDTSGKPLYCIGVAHLVTESKQLIEKLEASEERYAAFINHSSEAIWRFETKSPIPIALPEDQLTAEFINNGYLAECNDQMAKLYGYEAAPDITNMPLTNFISVDDSAMLNHFRGFIQAGFKLVNVETHETDKYGNDKIFLNNLMGIVENEKLVRVWGTQRDITEQKLIEAKAQRQLEQSKNFFKSLISDSLDGIIVLDHDACITYAATSITNVLGYLPHEVIGKKSFEFVHPDDVLLAINGFIDETKKIRKRELELRFKSKKGEWVWMLVRARNLYHQPSVKGMVVYFTNITQRKHSENVLKESEKRFRCLADTLPVMIWVSDERNQSTYVSKCWSDFTGISLEEIVSSGWKNIIHPDDYETTMDLYNLNIKKKLPFVIEYRIRAKDGNYKYVVDHGIPRLTSDGIYMGYIGSVIDINYRKAAEQKLRYQERMIENIRDAIVSTDLDFNIIAWNNMAEEIYGLKKEEVMGKHIRSIISQEYISVSRENVLIELYEKDSWEGEVYFDRKDGKRFYLFFSVSFVKNEKGERIGLVGIHRDITQRYETQLALRISEERYRSVVDALSEGIVLQDSEGKIIACNRSATAILGNDLLGSPLKTQEWKLIKEDGTLFDKDEHPFSITLKTGKGLQGMIIGLQRPGKSLTWFSVNTEPIYYSDQSQPDAIVTSFFDISERRHQEKWLSLEKDVLEFNALPSATLKDTVDHYLKGIEKMFSDISCSILLLREDKETIQHLSAPGLPVPYCEAVNGIKIGPKVGSCGTAMFFKQTVITADISTDPLWEDFRELALKYDLRSCWSFPIINSHNEVLATIAAYHKYPKVPTDKELKIMDVACNLLRIILESKKTEADLRLSNERYLLATKATHDAIYDWDIVENTVYRGESFYSLFGYLKTQVGGLLDFLEQKLHADDRSRVLKSLKRFIDNRRPDIWESEYRFLNASGDYVVVYDRAFLIFNHEGNITRLVGSMMDISERKELETRLVKQEVDKQKLVAQAVVNAQEKERGEIGKELHDNVNQILSTARLYLELAKNDENERLNLIKRSYDSIYDAINEIRNISRSLVPPSIGDLGLIESIEDLVENVRATKKLYIEFCYSGNVDEILGQKQKLMLFRIIQEQVSNVLKHADAHNIIIELMIDGHIINLAVSDDGKGFDLEELKNNKGVGLQNIASRTELFNGKINIVTAPQKGCKLNIHVPISKL